jgi:hypothetical protein
VSVIVYGDPSKCASQIFSRSLCAAVSLERDRNYAIMSPRRRFLTFMSFYFELYLTPKKTSAHTQHVLINHFTSKVDGFSLWLKYNCCSHGI